MRQQTAERDLIGRMRARDGSAVTDLASLYGPRIQQLAFRYLKNWEDAEEVAQDVLLKVYRKIEAFRGDAALSSWIYRITFNTAMSRLRSAKFNRTAEVQSPESHVEGMEHVAAEPADWTSLADDQVMRAQMRTKLIDALTHLPEVYRVPVLLRDIHGLSTEEASAVLKVKPQTLKSRLHRGRLILRKHMGEFSEGLGLHRETIYVSTVLERRTLVPAQRRLERPSNPTLHNLDRHGGNQVVACPGDVDRGEAGVAPARAVGERLGDAGGGARERVGLAAATARAAGRSAPTGDAAPAPRRSAG